MNKEEYEILKEIIKNKEYKTNKKYLLDKDLKKENNYFISEKITAFLIFNLLFSLFYGLLLSFIIEHSITTISLFLSSLSAFFMIHLLNKTDDKLMEKKFNEEINIMNKYLKGIKMSKEKYLFLDGLLSNINYEKIDKKTFKKIFLKEYAIYKNQLKERSKRLKKLK